MAALSSTAYPCNRKSTVSYTHLDVYKRQDIWIAGRSADTVTGVGVVWVPSGLRPVLGDRKGPHRGPVGAQTADVIDHRNREHGLRAHVGGARGGDEVVAAVAGCRDRIGDALEVPIVAAIV